MVLQERVDDKNGLQVMDILSLLSLSENINFWADVSLSNFRKLGLHVVGESSKFFDIDRLSCLNVVANVLDEGFPDDDVLSLWLKRFQISCSSLRRHVVLSWILVSMLQDPVNDLLNIQHF